MDFLAIDEVAAKWGITPRQVRSYCANSRISGATLEQGECQESGVLANMNEVDVSEQDLLDRHPDVLRALLKDHARTAYDARSNGSIGAA